MQRQKNVCAWSAEGEGEGEHEVAPEKPGTGLGEAPLADVSKKEVKRGEEKPATDSSRAPSLAKTRELRPKRQASEPDASPAPKAIRLSVGSGERPEAMLEMESWEMAPGLLTEETGTENIAFSGAYLTSAQPIPILPDIGIHIIVAKPGSSKRWGAETNKVRACTVAADKVRVMIGETSFLVGLNGAFHIKPGQSCLVENRFYLDATIHCFSFDYGLVSEEH